MTAIRPNRAPGLAQIPSLLLAPSAAEATAPRPCVLALNAGSSSLKFGLYGRSGAAQLLGQFSGLEPGGAPRWALAGQPVCALQVPAGSAPFDAALHALLDMLASQPTARLAAVSHRIVHGGDVCTRATVLDDHLLGQLMALSPLAPLHQPHNLAGVIACQRALPGLPQIGCFDTAFHATLPVLERSLPLPPALVAQGLRRYGFHGLSYQYVSETLARYSTRAGGRALLMHLGSGASLCATLGGKSFATTMGFSALDGLMMGTRCGSLDPGVLLHLWRQGWQLAQVERLLYTQCGLRGVSELSSDMRTLRASASPAAAQAIALFIHRIVREAGAMVALLGGIDLLAFTGGIGEHDVQLRADVVQQLGFLGLRLDASANAAAAGNGVCAVQAGDSRAELWVVPTDEGRVAAQSAFRLLDTVLA